MKDRTMIVYDVIQTITAVGASMSSYAAGEWLINHFDSESAADDFASRCNECCLIYPHIKYSVEAIDEESPNRKNYLRDSKL